MRDDEINILYILHGATDLDVIDFYENFFWSGGW